MNDMFEPSAEIPLDVNSLSQIVGEDKEKYCIILKLFVETGPDNIQGIKTAYEDDNLKQMKEMSHKLKCSASNISAYELAAVCQSLEDATTTVGVDIDDLIEKLDVLFIQISNFVDGYCKKE